MSGSSVQSVGFFARGFLKNGKRLLLTTKEITGIYLQDTESDLNRVRLEMFRAAGTKVVKREICSPTF